MPELMLVMPAYNEQASVRKVVLEWFDELQNWTEDFTFLAIDDGSTDGTLAILKRLKEKLGDRFEILSRENRGHGQTCLEGYRIALERKAAYVFQIDSDGQCDPQFFFRLWREREKYDVIYGQRVKRDDGWRRMLATHVMRACLLGWCGVDCYDANVPYRLMRTPALAGPLPRIPKGFFLANVALAVLLRKAAPEVRHAAIPIRFRERYGGEPKVKMSNFLDKALELRRQLQSLS